MSPPDSLLGRWRLVTDPPPRGHLGLRLTLVIDSVAADSLFGAVAMMFSGNVGIDPARFGPLTGRVRADTVALLVPPTEPPGSTLRLTGTLALDTIWLSSFEIGNDQMIGESATLLLVREN